MLKRSKLRTWMFENGYTVKDFCIGVGLTRETVFSWMSGKKSPRESNLNLIKAFTKGAITKREDLLNK